MQNIFGQQQTAPSQIDINSPSMNMSTAIKMGMRIEFQLHTLKITQPNTRYDFDFLAKVTNSNIIGFFMTTNEVADNELNYNILHSTLQLTINNNEIFPSGMSAAMYTHRVALAHDEAIYQFNEKADGSQIKGTYTSGGGTTFPEGGYEVTLCFVEIVKPKN